MDKFMVGLFSVLGAIAISCMFGMLCALPVMWIWNDSLVPAVTFAHPISWVQAWGLMILTSLLFNTKITKD